MTETHWQFSEKDFFHNLPSEKEEFISLAVKKQINRGQFIFFEGDPGDSAFYLEHGVIKVFKISPFGKESIVFIRRSGEMFGLAEVIGGKSRACNAQAFTGCTLYVIRKKEMEFLLSRHFSLARRVMEVLGRRLRYLGDQIESLMVCDVTTRLLKLLICMSYSSLNDPDLNDPDALCAPITISIRLTQQHIAEMIGSCQQTVSETLKRLEEEGLIRISRKEIIVLKPSEIMNRVST